MFIKNKILSSLCIALLAMPIMLCLYLLLQQHFVKEKMEEELESRALTTIHVLKAEVKWIELNKELIVNGEMFDVKEVVENNDSLLITGLFDYQEKKIKENIASLFNKQSNSKSPLQKIIEKYSDQFFTINSVFSTQQILYFTIKKIKPNYLNRLVTQLLEIPTPPPNNFMC